MCFYKTNNIHEKITRFRLAESSAVQVSALQITHPDDNWLKDNRKFCKLVISRNLMTEILCANFESSFLE